MITKDDVIKVLEDDRYTCKEEGGVIAVSFDDPTLGISFPTYQITITEEKISVWMVGLGKDGLLGPTELFGPFEYTCLDEFCYFLDY